MDSQMAGLTPHQTLTHCWLQNRLLTIPLQKQVSTHTSVYCIQIWLEQFKRADLAKWHQSSYSAYLYGVTHERLYRLFTVCLCQFLSYRPHPAYSAPFLSLKNFCEL